MPVRINSETTVSSKQPESERGASLVEYALLIALIAVVCVAAVTFFGSETGRSFSDTASSIKAA